MASSFRHSCYSPSWCPYELTCFNQSTSQAVQKVKNKTEETNCTTTTITSIFSINPQFENFPI